MTIEWLAGNRLRGTTAERPNFGLPSGSVGGWVELGRASNASLPDVTGLANKRYLMFLSLQESNASRPSVAMRFNADSGSNYVRRGNVNDGQGDYTNTNLPYLNVSGQPEQDTATIPMFTVGYVANKSDKEKLLICHNALAYQGAGATDALERRETVGKWTNTSDAIDQVTITTSSGGSYTTDSELIILGWDPADEHTSNFWEELASVNGDGTGGFDTGVFSKRKYLWVQAWLDNSTSSRNNFRVGNTTVDTGNNYVNRGSTNGGAEATETSVTIIRGNATSYSTPTFFNMFIINNSANEKLLIGHLVNQNTAGAGNAPSRIDFISKWADTSNQIDIIEAFPSSGNYNTGSIIKVWGAD